jgi:hypothetical protein
MGLLATGTGAGVVTTRAGAQAVIKPTAKAIHGDAVCIEGPRRVPQCADPVVSAG